MGDSDRRFEVVSGRLAGHAQGETVSESELVKAGANVDALITGGHIQEAGTPTESTAEEGGAVSG